MTALQDLSPPVVIVSTRPRRFSVFFMKAKAAALSRVLVM
jgi:hypothetical protein